MASDQIETPPKARRQSSRSLVKTNEIPVYIQRSSLQFDDILYFLTSVDPARFNIPKPPILRLSDDAWAALQLRVDHVAKNILDPHRYYAAAAGVGLLITIVFYSIRPGYDRKRIHAYDDDDRNTDNRYPDDDEMYDDYMQDDLYERNHSMDDVVVAELNYLNAQLDRSMIIWRIGLTVSLVVLFGSVIFIAILMERRNQMIDDHIRQAIEEIRPRFEDEGIAVEYRTRSTTSEMRGISFLFLGQYIRPTRVVVFRHLDSSSPRSLEGGGQQGNNRTKGSFFSEDYQRRYFPPRSLDNEDGFSATRSCSSFSII